MMRAVSDEFPDSWDQTIPWILFAYSHTAKYSLETLVSLHLNYCLLDRSLVLCYWSKSLALTADKKAKNKAWFDKKARDRTFEPGDEVLTLLFLPGHLLQAKYFGPYKVLQKPGPVDYVIDTPNR